MVSGLLNKVNGVMACTILSLFYFIYSDNSLVFSERVDLALEKFSRDVIVSKVSNHSASTDVESESALYDADDQFIINQLKNQYYNHMDEASARILLLDKIRGYLIDKYGEGWRKKLDSLIDKEFFDQRDILLADLINMDAYQEQSEDFMASAIIMAASGVSNQEMEEGVWDIRYSVFGDDANDIWQSGHNRRQLKVAFKQLDSMSLTLSERIQAIKFDIEKIYTGQEVDYLSDNSMELSTQFIETGAVSASLSQMSKEDRRQALRDIRSGFGMDAAALERWDQLDRQREARDKQQ